MSVLQGADSEELGIKGLQGVFDRDRSGKGRYTNQHREAGWKLPGTAARRIAKNKNSGSQRRTMIRFSTSVVVTHPLARTAAHLDPPHTVIMSSLIVNTHRSLNNRWVEDTGDHWTDDANIGARGGGLAGATAASGWAGRRQRRRQRQGQ